MAFVVLALVLLFLLLDVAVRLVQSLGRRGPVEDAIVGRRTDLEALRVLVNKTLVHGVHVRHPAHHRLLRKTHGRLPRDDHFVFSLVCLDQLAIGFIILVRRLGLTLNGVPLLIAGSTVDSNLRLIVRINRSPLLPLLLVIV